MSSASSTSAGLLRLARKPPRCLLRCSRMSLTRNCSTTTQISHTTALWHSTSQRLGSSVCRWPGQKLLLGSFREGPFAQARRRFSPSPSSLHSELIPPKPGDELHVTFVDKGGEEHTFEVARGDNLLDIAQENEMEMEGACGGSCACSTCHVIVEDEEMYNKMDEPDDDENDMLDLAFGLTETSRLGCQVKMRPELDGLRVKLPAMTRNLQASDFSQKNERSD